MEGQGGMKPLYPCGIKKNSVKEVVHDEETPKKISHINFGLLSPPQMQQLAEFQVVNRELYQPPKRDPMPYGVLDSRLGISNKTGSCRTCGQKILECAGHYGYIKLALPVFHIGYLKNIIVLLQMFCKYCSRIKLPDAVRQYYLNELRTKKEVLQRKALLRNVMDRAKKVRICPYCGELNGVVQKSGVLKITHERYREKKYQDLKNEFLREFEEALKLNDAIVPHINKAKDDINPLRALQIFSKIPAEDVELMDMDPALGRPENLILQHLLVPPVCIRPSVCMDAAQGSNEDDLTMGLMKIVSINAAIEQDLEKGVDIGQVMEKWDNLQIHAALYINSDMPGIPPALAPGKPTRGFCQRLKGKKGRFRGNLSGKRVDFSGRTVISPDPNLRIDEVAVPVLVAMVMTYPEKVFSANIERLRKMVLNGPDAHPGANYIINRADGSKSFLKFGDRARAAANLRPGDIVERHVIDGDVVLFNRQPSLHRISIMAHRARVMPWRTFRFNECVCGPYNADFDGDEMNLHVPQTEEARAEAMTLMAVNQNLITPRNGEPLVAAIQDFITSAYLLTRKDLFYDRAEFCRICSFIYDAKTKVDLPPPCIIKPIELWSGKQIFNVLIRPNKESKILVTMEVAARTYSGKGDYQPLYMCPKDGYVLIHNSELLCGSLDKKTLGGGSKQNLFHVLMRDYSTAEAASCMSKLSKLCARWLADHGFSIGISDVQPSKDLKQKKTALVNKGYAECDRYIQQFLSGELPPQPGCNLEETLEAKLSKELSDIRDHAGSLCIAELPYFNSPLIMALCGSKGSNINISQMIACVGQQTVGGARIPTGFIHRTLPHFPLDSKAPKAKGFVKNSFYSGMTATEFFFHTMGGREGLVDTAVKTAETGYMQRRLMKALEDLSVQYDNTVRNSVGGIVQFVYGDDGLDPTGMEAQEKPVDFQRVLKYIKAIHPRGKDRALWPWEIKERVEAALRSPMFVGGVDETGVRERSCSNLFLDEIKSFFLGRVDPETGQVHKGIVDSILALRKRYGLSPTEDKAMDDGVEEVDVISRVIAVNRINGLTEKQLKEFFILIRHKFKRAEIEPGTAVGALGAQSIGEPGTQMTLKTFHFAGVASMNITLGVPRIKEIINASTAISTPIITATLVNDRAERAARIVKGRIEKTTLGEVAEYIKEVYNPGGCYISVKLDMEAIQALQLEITAESVQRSILAVPRTKLKDQHVVVRSKSKLWVSPVDTSREQMFFSLQAVKNMLPNVLVRGIPTVSRAVINKKKQGDEVRYNLLVEGDDLLHVMSTPGVVGTKTTCNHIMEVETTLGIEAARVTIMNEIQYTMREHGMSIDTRHVMLLADLMCFRGEVLGITRFGIAKMKESVLMLASFEKTTDHLFDASVHARQDEISGVSECIIMGIPIPIGTGLFRLLRKTDTPKKMMPTPLLLNRPKSSLDIAKHL